MIDHAAGQIPKDHTILRSISALIASLPASENKNFREEFDTVSMNSLHSPCGAAAVVNVSIRMPPRYSNIPW